MLPISSRLAAGAALLLSPSLAWAADSVGRVADREGQAARRPVGSPRWAPAEAGQPLEQGELLKTGARGANALKVALAGGGQLLLGPGAQVELLGPAVVSVLAGEVLVVPGQPLNGPVAAVEVRGLTAKVAARKALRHQGAGGLEELAEEPAWVASYEREETKAGALGALLAKVDGRDVPLTIGYHSVQVDVRDGIARTVIEESFKNHTSSVLEGVFYFPLPAEASISGFSMWIGDQQVHGEIVEKEKARAIYETILREKRDPGLLEWEGGSLFKARVYPIGAEKRIQISYTEVLPRVLGPDGSSTWVYRYALESDALRQHPLERLQVRATVSSTRPLAEVACPSHPARVEKTAHAARVEHAAEEVRAAKDFELRVTTEPPKGGREAGALTATAHRRGQDGYFLLLIDTPPAPAEETRAALLQPLDLLVVCDTSGSVEGTARENQARFVAALLEGLGEKDTFNLITCDSDALAAFPRAQAATPANVEAALGKLAAREPLGWSDLDRAFGLAAKLSGATTKVVYVGDGAVTTGDADPAAFAARLSRAWPSAGPPVHAVVPGSFAEPLALRGMAAVGEGGTVRSLAGQDQAVAAFELLRDLSAPLVRGLEVRVEGLQTAAVHPTDVPALVAGSQQVVVGRYDPRSPAKRGAVLVAGRRGGVPFRLAGELALPEQEDPDGASFIPRLWARRQLDHLLAQGSGPEVRERVIALSEDYQLITPWTSFLVLETDADRERFQVKKKMRMRDGEELFTKARQGAEQELARAQMQKARRWRRAERARVLAQLEDMGRGLAQRLASGAHYGSGGGVAFAEDSRANTAYAVRSLSLRDESAIHFERALPLGDADMPAAEPEAPADQNEQPPAADDARADEAEDAEEELEKDLEGKADKRLVAKEALAGEGRQRLARGQRAGFANYDGYYGAWAPGLPAPDLFPTSLERQPTWLDGLLPWIGQPVRPSAPAGWSPEALALVAGLDRRPRVKALAAGAGLRITVRREQRSGHELVAGQESAWVLGSDRWAARHGGRPGEDARLEWVVDGQRGALTLAWLLGARRPATAEDATGWPGPFAWGFGEEPAAFVGWTVEVAAGELRLSHAATGQKLVIAIDASRGLVTRIEHTGPAGTTVTELNEAQEVGGAWWPGLIVTKDPSGAITSRERIAVEPLDPAAMTAALAPLQAARERALLVGPLPSPRAARVALAANTAGLEERWALLGALGQDGRWSEAWSHLDALAALAGDRSALVPVRATCWSVGRRLEELSGLLLGTAAGLATREADAAAAEDLIGWGGGLGTPEEQLRLFERLTAVVTRRAGELPALAMAHEERMADALERAGRPDQALARRRALVEKYPGRVDLVQRLARTLAGLGDLEGALAALKGLAAKKTGAERLALEWEAVQHLQGASDLTRVVAEIERLVAEHPAALVGQHVHQARLQALVQLDREAEARAWAKAALQELQGQAPLEPGLIARAGAAISFTFEGAHEGLDPESRTLLVASARALLRRGAEADALLGWFHSWQFLQTPEAKLLAAELHARLAAEELPPADLVRLANLARVFESYAETSPERTAAWRRLTTRMIERWRAALAAKDEAAAGLLEGFLRQDPAGSEVGTAWRRELLERAATPAERRALAIELIGRLTGQRWSEPAETEAWQLLLRAGPLEDEAELVREGALDHQALLLVGLVDWSSASRADATLEDLEAARSRATEGPGKVAVRIELDEAKLLALDLKPAQVLLALRRAGWIGVAGRGERGPCVDVVAPTPEQLEKVVLGERAGAQLLLRDVAVVQLSGPSHRLPRRKQAAARAAALKETQAVVRERLRELALPGLLEWLLVEGAWLDVKVGGADRRAAARATSQALLERRLSPAARSGPAPTWRQRVIVARALCTALHVLAAEAPGAPGRELVALLRRANDAADPHLDWRKALATALLALDDADQLLAAIDPWSQGDGLDAPAWARQRAWLLADRDRLADAAAVLAALDQAGESLPADLTALADLLLALGKTDEAAAARGRAHALRPEHELSQLLWQMAQRVSRTGEGIPEPLDPEAPRMLVTLLSKAEDPRQHAWVFQQLYLTTREPRLLEAMADAIPGHSPGRMLLLLESYRGLLQQVQEEASVDRAVARATALRGEARLSALDKRGLDLFLYLLAQAAAAQSQGGEPHAARALAALRAAFPGPEAEKWAPGEQRRWAEVLSSWAPAGAPVLNEELLRQLGALAGAAEVGSDERLHLTGHLARALAACGRTADAAHALGGALAASTQANEGLLPPRLWPWAIELVGWLQAVSEWRPAEALLEQQLAKAAEAGLAPVARSPLLRRLHALRAAAVRQGVELRQGGGLELLRAELATLRAELIAPGREDLAVWALHDLVRLLDAAHHQGGGALVAAAAEEAGVLYRTDLPRLLAARQHRPAHQVLGTVAELVERLRSPVDALELLVATAETEPGWLRRQQRDTWSQEEWRLSELRVRAVPRGIPAALEERLLRSALTELARRLARGRTPPSMLRLDHGHHFWSAQADQFLRVSREAMAARPEREEVVTQLAWYLEHGLGRRDVALEALREAHARKVLGPSGQEALIATLERASLHAEAVPLIEALLLLRTEDLGLRLRLALALHRSGQAARRDAALAAAEGWLNETRRREEGQLRELGRTFLEVGLPEKAEALLREALALRARARGNAPEQGGELAGLYELLALACAARGRTAEAVEAAAGAVVAWGPHRDQRGRMLALLDDVLARAADLPGYAKAVEAEEAKTGLVNPTLRRALARVFRGKGDLAAAERQLAAALEVAPDDAESLALRVELHDARQAPAEAARAQLALARHLARDPAAWRALGERLARLGQAADAERVFTHLAEYSPQESEGHQALAEVREGAGRLQEAADQWRQVARIRSREPQGWTGLLRCLVALGAREEAVAVGKQLQDGAWDEGVKQQARELLRQLEGR